MSIFRTIPAMIVVAVIAVYGLLYGVTLGVLHANGLNATHLIGVHDGGDSYQYVALADTMLTHGRFAMNATAEPESFRTPGYPLFITAILVIFKNIVVLPLVQIVLAALSCGLIFLIGEHFFSRGVALGAAVLFAIEPAVITNSFISAADIPFVFFMLCGIYVLTVKQHTPLYLLWGGVLMGTMALIRPLGLYVIPLAFLWLLWETRAQWRILFRTGVLFLVGVAIIIMPWMARNYMLLDHFSISSIGSYNLLFYVQEFEHQYTGKSKAEMSAEMYRNLNASLTDRIESFRFADKNFKLALEGIRAHPFAYAAFHLYSTIPFYFGSSIDTFERALYLRGLRMGQPPQDVNISVLLRTGDVRGVIEVLTSNIPVLLERLFWTVMFFAALGTTIVAVYKRKENAPLFILFFGLILAFGLMTGPVSYSRYRLPADPFIFMLGYAGVTYIVHLFLNRMKHKLP